jgi:hypothetical protein
MAYRRRIVKRDPKQWEIILRMRDGHERYISDRRGSAARPRYSAFDIVSRDEPHTIAPNRRFALEVAAAYRSWAREFGPAGLAAEGTVVTRRYVPDQVAS